MNTTINGYKINYEVEGSGKPIVLFHGWLASLETMKPLQKNLSKNFKVYNIDILGFGKSDLPKEPLYTDNFGDFVNDVLQALNIENPILIGHSNGGKAIINYAGRYNNKINKIILIDSTGIKPHRSIKYYSKIYSYKCAKKILSILPGDKNKRREQLLNKYGSSDYKASPEVLRKTMNNILNEGQEKIMPNIKAPTLLIWGENDNATPFSDTKKIEKLIPDCGTVSFKGAGHFSYLDCLPQCLVIINEFLKDDII